MEVFTIASKKAAAAATETAKETEPKKKPVRKKAAAKPAVDTVKPQLKILFAASECVPFVKTGGLADVMGALPQEIAKLGADVRVILPLFREVPDAFRHSAADGNVSPAGRMRHAVDFEVEMGWRRQYCGIEALEMNGVTYYFVDNRYYFNRSYIYGSGGDEAERFAFFCRAVLNALQPLGWKPDIIHANDWQAGFIPALLEIQYAHLPFYANIKTVMSIHNLQYQGVFDRRAVQDLLGLGDSLFTDDKLEFFGCANFLKAGLIYADYITTVSPGYAEEIQTAFFGEKLDGLLRARHETVSGVLNGIDVERNNPATDKVIAETFTAEDPAGKAKCKAALQAELGLAQDADAPVIAMITRLTSQKGLDLVDRVISEIMETGAQFVILGKGDAKYTSLFSWAQCNWQGRVAARFEMNIDLAQKIYAGADMFLMPSLFEPCGLSQMISMRYGTIPIVRETGGLRDTVLSLNEFTLEGSGFTFFSYNAHDMLEVIRRAVSYYKDKPEVWRKLVERGMTADFSWKKSASEYLSIYNKLT
ncbi:MAG: glycogen synthase GlgA [Oscillospiraceae bacterium]|jgi:starch synthase|nr:glycogen synthase GlgA [Oscillospiraceae bacterium]